MAKGIKVDGWLDRKAAAEHIGLSDYWLEKHAHTDNGPRYIQHGRKCWYRREDLDAWLDEKGNVEASGAGGRTALDNLWHMGRKRREAEPNVIELETHYKSEHGAPLKPPGEKKRRWEKFCETLSVKQRQLLAEVRAV